MKSVKIPENLQKSPNFVELKSIECRFALSSSCVSISRKIINFFRKWSISWSSADQTWYLQTGLWISTNCVCFILKLALNYFQTQNHDFWNHFRSQGHFRFVENYRNMDNMGVNRSEMTSEIYIKSQNEI